MAAPEFSWDSFPPTEAGKEQKNGHVDTKRRHDDLPRYFPPGDRKPRQFNNRSGNPGRNLHDSRNVDQGSRNPHYNNRQDQRGQMRKPRTSSDSFEDRSKSAPMKPSNRPPFRADNRATNGHVMNNLHHMDNKPPMSRNLQQRLEPQHEKEMRMQIMRMRGHMQYLKDQLAYKDQVVHHKEQVILALRKKLAKLDAGTDETENSTSPVEPPKPDDIDKMEADLAKPEDEELENERHVDIENGVEDGEIVDDKDIDVAKEEVVVDDGNKEVSHENDSEEKSVEKVVDPESTESEHKKEEPEKTEETTEEPEKTEKKDESVEEAAEASEILTEPKPEEKTVEDTESAEVKAELGEHA